jgi:hypothetical protein
MKSKHLQEFLELFIPTKKKYHRLAEAREDFNSKGFSMVLGYNFENNPMFADLGVQEDPKNLGELKSLHIAEGSDNYFTPNLFLGNQFDKSKRSRKEGQKVCWLQDIFLDIDSTGGITDPAEAQNVLYEALQDLGIPRPSALVHTSTNPSVRLQVHWLIDPLWIYDNRQGTIDHVQLKEWYRVVVQSLAASLVEKLPEWELDVARTMDITTYARLPYSYNQKTGQRVEVLDLRAKRWVLEDKWITNLIKEYCKQTKSFKVAINKEIKLLEHPQIKVLLEGVSEGYRNSAQYALALACKYDNISLEEATKIILEQNKKCQPAERENKVRSIIKSAYRSIKGVSSIRVAEIVSDITGQEVKPDPALFLACQEEITIKPRKKNRGIYTPKELMVRKVVKKALEIIRAGAKVLPSIKEMAKLTKVSAGTLRSRGIWKNIIRILKTLGLQLNKEAHYHHKYIILERGKQVLREANSSVINLDKLERVLRAYNDYSVIDMLEQKTEQQINSFIELLTAEIMGTSPP